VVVQERVDLTRYEDERAVGQVGRVHGRRAGERVVRREGDDQRFAGDQQGRELRGEVGRPAEGEVEAVLGEGRELVVVIGWSRTRIEGASRAMARWTRCGPRSSA
jgi:hypothetical protein